MSGAVERHVGIQPPKMEKNQNNPPVKKSGPVCIDHVLLALQETREEREVRIRSLFNFFDATNLGYLDYAQIEVGLSALQIPGEYKYAKDLLKVCDANRDGRVDYHEFRKYMDHKELELYRIFQAIDVEHNGSILPEELWDALVKAVSVSQGLKLMMRSLPALWSMLIRIIMELLLLKNGGIFFYSIHMKPL